MAIATWGPVTFEVSADRVRTFRDARRSGEARWAEHVVYAGKPAREFLGPGLSSLSLSVRLDRALGVVPEDEIKALAEQRDIGAHHALVMGGEVVADFTLDGFSERWDVVDAGGRLLVATVDLNLKEYA